MQALGFVDARAGQQSLFYRTGFPPFEKREEWGIGLEITMAAAGALLRQAAEAAVPTWFFLVFLFFYGDYLFDE